MRVLLGYYRQGYTLVEIVIIIAVLAALAVTVIVAHNGVQRRAADTQTRQTVADGLKNLQLHYVVNKSYPSNIAGTEYAPPLSVAVALYTNAPQTPVYDNLTSEQNAQLFLNSCNGFMPITDGTTTYNNACVYSGNNIHVKGTISSNVVIQGPALSQSDFVLTCGTACNAAQADIIAKFVEQGGAFPITVPKDGSPLPAPTSVTLGGSASDFCIEGRAAKFADIIYHAVPGLLDIQQGPCPPNPAFHYP